MSPLKEVTNNDKPVEKQVKKTKGKVVGRPAKAAVDSVVPVKVKDDEEKNKAPNFHPDEDELIAQAWVSATENPIVGCGQKAATFWADVHSRYCVLQIRSSSVDVKFPRSWNQIKGRFLRHIQVNVGVFNRYYKRAKETLPSGTPDTVENIMAFAMELYAGDQNKPFRFSLCVPILHSIPKFDPFMGGGDEDDDGAPTAGSVMGSTLPRPIGSKAAKERRKEHINAGKTVEEIQRDFNRLVGSALRKEAFDELSALYKMYIAIGDVASANATQSDLRDLVFANKMDERQFQKEEDNKRPKKSSESSSDTTPPVGVPTVIDLGNPERNSAFASYDLDGIRLPPDDCSEFSDTLIERIRKRDEEKEEEEKTKKGNLPSSPEPTPSMVDGTHVWTDSVTGKPLIED